MDTNNIINLLKWREMIPIFKDFGIIIKTDGDRLTKLIFKDKKTNVTLYEENFPNQSFSSNSSVIFDDYKLIYTISNGEIEKLFMEDEDCSISYKYTETEKSITFKHPRRVESIQLKTN